MEKNSEEATSKGEKRSRENTIEEKRRMRMNRKKRKRFQASKSRQISTLKSEADRKQRWTLERYYYPPSPVC